MLHFNMVVDAGSSILLIIKAFMWIFGNGDGIFSDWMWLVCTIV